MKVSSSENSFAERLMSVPSRLTRLDEGSRVRSPTWSTAGRSTGPRRAKARSRASSSENEKGLTR